MAVDWRVRASQRWMRAWTSNARRAIEALTCLRVGGSAVASGSVLVGCVQCLFILVRLLVWVVLLPVLLMFLCWLIAG